MGPRSHPRSRLVSFSGIDGAGKSTQIEALRLWAEGTGLRVRVIAFWDEVACLTWMRENAGHALFRGDKGVGSPEKPIERRDKNVRSPFMSLMRLFLYLLDAVSLRRVVQKELKDEGSFVICDRYAYDELANLPLHNRLSRLYVRLLLRIVPHPGVSFFLDADPEQARARKPEYPLEFLKESRASYLTLSELAGGITVIPPMPIQEASSRILEKVLVEPRPGQDAQLVEDPGGGAAA